MDKSIKNRLEFFASLQVTVFLLLILAVSIAVATFLERDFGVAFAREQVYNSHWFETLIIVLVLNFIGSIYSYELFRSKKFSVLLLHLSLVVILLGAATTRYFSTETYIQLREGEITDLMSENQQLPFRLQLVDFQVDRYQGSWSPSNYTSTVIIHDPMEFKEQTITISMNNVLDYKGYRFFQYSYDQDEEGSVFQVSKDVWGTRITYLGYFLLFIGILLNFFNPYSRLNNLFKLVSNKTLIFMIFSCLLPIVSAAATVNKQDFLKELNTLMVQNQVTGRVEPFLSFSEDILKKLSKTNSVDKYSASEFILGIMTEPEKWKDKAFIVIANKTLAQELGAENRKVSFNQLFDFSKESKYKLAQRVDSIYRIASNQRNAYEKEILNLDERINIFYMLYNNQIPKIFPPAKIENQWMGFYDLGFSPQANEKSDSVNIAHKMKAAELYSQFMIAVRQSQVSNEWERSLRCLLDLKNFQRACTTINENKIKAELIYTQLNIFSRLVYPMWILGFLLLGLYFWTIFKESVSFKIVHSILNYAIIGVFAIFTVGIAMRWYISDHAPWSDGYEVMLLLGWLVLIPGLFFVKRSSIILAIASILSGIFLVVAQMSWMNPEITNLLPVLNSKWLIIHVAVVTISYALFSIASFLGLINLILMIIKPLVSAETKSMRTSQQIQYLSYIVEIVLIVGLLLLTLGSFLGGVWANESWGRYWAWDPKESWAMVSILLYAVVIHLRNIPRLNNLFVLNTLAFISYASVIMTFLGVNFYFKGLHSYGKLPAPEIPNYVYFLLGLILVIILLAWRSEYRLNNRN